MEEDHIVVKRLDDVNERGYRNYNFLKALREERKRFKLPKSTRSMLTPKTAYSSEKYKKIKL